MLCLHGVESYGLRFVGLASRLPGVNVVAPDLRGHGRSPKTGPWTIEQHIADLRPLVESSDGVAAWVVLGHSYGGLVAWELARAMPGSVAALILVDPAIAVSAELAAASMSYEFSSVAHSWSDASAAFLELAAARVESGHWAAALDVAVAMEKGADGRLHPLVDGDAVAAAWRQMQEPLRESPYRGPTQLIEARREAGAFVSPPLAAGLRSQLGDQLDHVVVDTSHTIPSDFPDVLAEVVGPFLARV
jgi:lipase